MNFNISKQIYSAKKRSMLLLEVIIAMVIVALCALPLLYTPAMIIKEQKKGIATLNLDHTVNHLYLDLLHQLQDNSISWDVIKSGEAKTIDQDMLQRVAYRGPPLNGTYQFDKNPHSKPSKDGKARLYLQPVHFRFVAPDISKEAIVFTYNVVIMRHSPPQEEELAKPVAHEDKITREEDEEKE